MPIARACRPVLAALIASCGGAAAAPAGPASPVRAAPDSPPVASASAEIADEAASGDVEPAPASDDDSPPAAVATAARPRIWSTGYITWIFDEADVRSRKIGTLRAGTGVALRDPDPRPGPGCLDAFRAVEPRGFVCLDHHATLDAANPVVSATAEAAAVGGGAPLRWAFSLGAPMYNQLPTAALHRLVMMRFLPRPPRPGDWARAFEDLATDGPLDPDGPVPSFLRDGRRSPNATDGVVRRSLPHASMVSFTRVFDHGGRRWLLAADLSVVPADRVRPYRSGASAGVDLGGGLRLPVAWMRRVPRAKHRPDATGTMRETGETWPALAAVGLTGREERRGGRRWLETSDAGHWVRGDHVRVARGARKLPETVRPDAKWIYLSMNQMTLVAYRGMEPVWATLHAPGRGGPAFDRPDVRNYVTPVGAWHLNWKERFATLSPDPGAPQSFWIADVPAVQYFRQPYALHGAYWHESFGEPMSAGCPNLAPRDAEWLFRFTDPALPDGWQAIAARGDEGTLVVVGP